MSQSSNEMFLSESICVGDNEFDDVIMLHMDIRDPLSKLKTLLEKKIGMDLKNYNIWLQDAQVLEPHKNLVDQCVEGEGIVQINVQIQTIKHSINIVDVLKPTEEALELLVNEKEFQEISPFPDKKSEDKSEKNNGCASATANDKGQSETDDEHSLKWILDNDCQFRKDQIKMQIPDDPNKWTVAQVQHWLQWAVREFNLTKIKLSDWNINGEQLCNVSVKEFEKKVPIDPGNIFRTHFELLRKCNFVAILQKRDGDSGTNASNLILHEHHEPKILGKLRKKSSDEKNLTLLAPTKTINAIWEQNAARSNTSSGHIQLWQFLLELLTDYQYKSIIQWISADGEFRLVHPEQVALIWGIRKSKPTMNYEKLSRALRYYYDGDMISKVHGKRFVYKFVCDLKQLIGYDARDIARLVSECSSKKKAEKKELNE